MIDFIKKYKVYYIIVISIILLFVILGICNVVSLPVAVIIPTLIVMGGFVSTFVLKDKYEQQKKTEEAKRKAEEEEAKREAEDEAKRKAEEEARKKAEEEAKRKAEEEARKKAEEEARKKAEEEAKRKAEEEKKRQEEEAKRKAEEEARKKAEEEAKRKAEEEYINNYENILKSFNINISKESETYKYFKKLYDEGYFQFYKKSSLNNIPPLFIEDNFPHFYEYGNIDDLDKSFKTLIGWLFALQLSELNPYDKTKLLKIGYELGGYNKYSNIYGYTFESDPNISRKVAAVIYVAMRGTIKPNIDKIRKEINGKKYSDKLSVLYSQNKNNVGKDNFWIDFREFMPTAPGPYAPGYTSRPDKTYPNEQKDEYNNLLVDRNINETIIKKYNLENEQYKQETVQAIADKEADAEHLFGKNRSTKNYTFHPVFGEDTIGIELNYGGVLSELVDRAIYASSRSRSILQSAEVSPKQYGRLRPGCSWQQEALQNSISDDRRNILTNFEIEDGDGSPTGYYDKNGNWIYKDAIASPKDFEKSSKNSLWANSYPSGHSSGIFGGAMVLMELMPNRADKILKAANQFAVNRTIARYHWTSDTINGRVLGSATNAVAHASNDYDDLLNKARKEIE